MKIQTILDELSMQYQILSYTDLSQAIADPTVIYRALRDGHKPTFMPEDRFLFYCAGHVGQKTLAYLNHAADIFDVSRCFLLVVCHSHDDFSGEEIGLKILPIESSSYTENDIISTHSLCALPWFHAEYMNQGEIRPCCFNKISSGKAYITLEEFFYSPDMEQLRQAMLNGEKPKSCQVCWDNESRGLNSLRQWRTKFHKEEFFTEYLVHPKLRSLVMRPSTVCNFKCRICNNRSSSLWLQEDYAHASDDQNKKKLYQMIERSRWFDNDNRHQQDLLNSLSDLKYIDIYGGEPLLIKEFKTILEHCIKIGTASRQILHFNTNASVFPKETFQLMDHFKETHISLSIDDIGERFEMERGGCWTEVDHNVNKFLALDPEKYKISILATVSNLNLLYLDELLDWANAKHLTYTLQVLDSPAIYHYTRVSQTVIDLTIKKYSNHENKFLRALAESLQNTKPVDTTEWIEITQTLDHRRGQCFKKSHPALAQGMGYV
jgi:molybdenum cofactor biosynthesis enzyme MoaA